MKKINKTFTKTLLSLYNIITIYVESGQSMILKVENLGKKYSKKADFTIKDISIHCNEYEIVGLVGHNGAGKSTTIKCITGMHPYEEGSIDICGFDFKKNPLEAKKNFGYVPDEFTLYEKMTGYEFINFMADIYRVSKEDREARIAKFQELFCLGDSIYKTIRTYSHGMKQKISIMAALIHNPKLFILDEPMVGLDPYTANQVKEFFKYHASEGNAVLFSSHNLDTVSKLCDRCYIIDQGRLLEEIDLKEFKKSNRDLEEYFLSITKRAAKV